jgi:hypothetical protein
MNKIQEIFSAWNISFNPNDNQSELALKRIEICNSCEHKKQNALFKNVCDLCGCSLKAKVFTPVLGACPDGRWDGIDNNIVKNKPMKPLRFISAQPCTEYYLWQVESLIQNFMAMGVNPNQIDIVCYKENGVLPDTWSKLANHYPARFLFYNDTRKSRHYVSSIRPNILKQHWERFPELKDEVIFYHDCDIIFTKRPISWITEEMMTDDKWYGSDTRSYISHDYIISKGEQVLDKMCEIVEIDKEVVRLNELNCIGAQYLMKCIDYQFWDDVERDCERLFKEITDLQPQFEKIWIDKMVSENLGYLKDGKLYQNGQDSEEWRYHELQIWTADMWAVLWNGWKRGYETIVHGNFKFSWATSSEDDFYNTNIFHNAGATNNKELFYKCDYMKILPYNLSLTIKDQTASKKYYQWIQEVGRKSALK